MLDIDVPACDVRSGDIGIDAENGAETCRTTANPGDSERKRVANAPSVPLAWIRNILNACGDRAGTWNAIEDSAGWDRTQTKHVVERHEGFPVHRFISDSHRGAYYRFAAAKWVPSHTDSRRKIRVVTVVRRTNLLADLHKTRRGTEVSELIVIFLDDPVVFIAKSEVKGQV